MAVDLNHRAVRSTVGSHAVDLEAERDCFEAQFPRPSQCEWIPQSAVFCATAYHAWDADKHIARWEGWKAGALARAMTPDRRPLTCPRCGATNANDAGELSASDDARRLDRLEQAYTDGARDPQAWREFMTRVAEVGFRAAIDGVRASDGWRPISTAPRDGTRILLRWKHRPARVGWWTDEESGTGWKCDGDQVVPAAAYQADATHWQPVPSDGMRACRYANEPGGACWRQGKAVELCTCHGMTDKDFAESVKRHAECRAPRNAGVGGTDGR